jgi:hypothetical protein
MPCRPNSEGVGPAFDNHDLSQPLQGCEQSPPAFFCTQGFKANPGLTLANAFSVTRLLHSSKRATAARENVMPDSYTNLLYHIVFSTKDRRPIIAPEYEPRIYYYIGGTIRSLVGGTIRSLGGICLELNGTLPASKN